MKRVTVLLLLLLSAARADESREFRAGEGIYQHAGLSFYLALPEDFESAKGLSLVVALHGAAATAESIASWYTDLTDHGFAVCAPKATGAAWNKADVKKAVEIVRHLLDVLPIDPGRVHGTGFSNGGAHLPFLVFHDDLPFRTVSWMGSGYQGGKVPRRAKKEMWVLALAGEQDYAVGAAAKTPDLLRGKVRQAYFLGQPELGHEIPDQLVLHHHGFMKAAEGRLGPGEGYAFPWIDDLEVAQEEVAERQRPALLYFYDERKSKDSVEMRVANEILFHPGVQQFGRKLIAVKLDVEIDEEFMNSIGVEGTPAIVVVDADFTPIRKFAGEMDAVDVAKALRAAGSVRSR